jgi:hypothetical protein
VFSAEPRHGAHSWRVNNFWADETRHGGRLLASRADLGQNQFTRHGEQISRHGEIVQEILPVYSPWRADFLPWRAGPELTQLFNFS